MAVMHQAADLFKGRNPAWTRPGHSVIKALEEAAAAHGKAASVLVIPLFDATVKIIARDLDNQVVFYCECNGGDAGEILARLGVDTPDQEITELVKSFTDTGMDLLDAATSAAVINADARSRLHLRSA